MFELIDVRKILRKHRESLRKDAKRRWVVLIFNAIPLFVALTLLALNHPLTAGVVGILVTAYALFAGLILNMVVFLFNIVTRAARELDLKNPKSKPRILLERLYANSLYSFLVTVIVLVVLVFFYILDLWSLPPMTIVHPLWFIPNPIVMLNPWLLIISAFVYYMTVHFLMNLLMIAKRLFAILSVQLEEKTE